jgi:hypothetical protein
MSVTYTLFKRNNRIELLEILHPRTPLKSVSFHTNPPVKHDRPAVSYPNLQGYDPKPQGYWLTILPQTTAPNFVNKLPHEDAAPITHSPLSRFYLPLI